jgi:nicotinamidase-related amidase
MAKVTYDKQLTALLVIDPYNDFISEGGKVWDRLKGVAEANRCIPHVLQVLNAARKADIRVFYALHRRRPAQGTITRSFQIPPCRENGSLSRNVFSTGSGPTTEAHLSS